MTRSFLRPLIGAGLALLLGTGAGMGVRPAAALSVETVTSPLGLTAYLAADQTLPIVSMTVMIPAGSTLDPAGKEGLATLMTRLLDEGAGDLDSQAFQQRLEDLAIDLSFDAGRDTLTVRLRTTTDTLDEAFGLLGLALTHPRFDADALERMRAATLASLRQQAGDPNALAQKAWFARVFPDHPYGHDDEGREETVRALTQDDVRAFAAAHLSRADLSIGVAGAIDASHLAPLLDRTFGPLPDTQAPVVPEATPRLDGSTTVVPFDVPQSTAFLGQPGLKRSDPDWNAAFVVNHILGGGGFSSRLMDEVREKRGLTYGVWSALYPYQKAGLWMAGIASQNARLPEALAVMKAEWARMASDGPTAQERADALTYLTGAWPLRFTSTESVAGMLASMRFYNLPADYIDTRNAALEALTLDDLRRVAKRLLDPARLTTVIVGKPDGTP
ncbi:M16 family metallopeptidase [Pararhodospirillum oryzae]|uniref:Peptidase M16 n=1 Tax=Pararhodospirillum oryzae TaxID=478448 RepID=A0A512HAS6_9PROT|nr:pitrilysin family protein [Pararhodospirillum oryzae]GEO82566.1 peptidase M16 [Pararhodospirillum oryzae]